MRNSQVFVVLCVVVIAGCYREPTHPAQVQQKVAEKASSAERAMPKDDIHAGLSTGPMSVEPGPVIEARDVEIGRYALTAPQDWVRRQSNSMFLITEFALAKADGDTEDGRLTVSSAMGSIADNIERWRGQFGGKPEKEQQEVLDIAGVQVTWVDFSGTFSDQRGSFAPATPKPGYRMLAAVIPVDGKQFFVKGYGPEKTVATHADRIRSFVQSLQAKGDAAPPSAEPQPTTEK